MYVYNIVHIGQEVPSTVVKATSFMRQLSLQLIYQRHLLMENFGVVAVYSKKLFRLSRKLRILISMSLPLSPTIYHHTHTHTCTHMIAMYDRHNDDWKYVTYLVFDAPQMKSKYEDRLDFLKKTIKHEKNTTYAQVVGTRKCNGNDDLNKQLKEVLKKGGEGLMLRQPGSFYVNGRSNTLLKVKTFHDEEAKVTSSEHGTGRLTNLMGKLHCILPNGVKFKVGTGFNDAQRARPPKVGSIITFKFQELSNSGSPRFPVFLHERPELTWDDVVKNAKTKIPFSSIPKKIPQLSQKQHSILFATVPSRDSSGLKIVTDDDDASDDESESKAVAAAASSSTTGKPVCRFGASCFRTNPKHLADFSHPTPPIPSPVASRPKSPSLGAAAGGSDDMVPCKFGSKCYQKSAQHLAKYSHPDASSEDEPLEAKVAELESKSASSPSSNGEWGVDREASDDDDDNGEEEQEMVTVTMPKKDWSHLQLMLTHLRGLSGPNSRVSVIAAGVKRKRIDDDDDNNSNSNGDADNGIVAVDEHVDGKEGSLTHFINSTTSSSLSSSSSSSSNSSSSNGRSPSNTRASPPTNDDPVRKRLREALERDEKRK
jgi:hypothetical protein